MSLFYNPKKRNVPIWVRIVMISVPIILIIVGWFALRKISAGKKMMEIKQQDKDIFDEIDM